MKLFDRLRKPEKLLQSATAIAANPAISPKNSSPDVWGPFTPYCPPRPPAEWLAMIAELDHLIDRYCAQEKLSADARTRIIDARYRQPLATIPDSIEFFKNALSDDRAASR